MKKIVVCDVIKNNETVETFGVEVLLPMVLPTGEITNRDITQEYMRLFFGNYYNQYCIQYADEFRFRIMIEAVNNQMKMIKEIYQQSQHPYYMQLLYNYLRCFYGVDQIPTWIEHIKNHMDYIDIVFSSCETEYQADDKMSEIIHYLEKQES